MTKQKTMHYSPSYAAVILFGGVNELARQLSISGSSVSRWRTSVHTGGSIPSIYHEQILELAKEQGIDFTAEDVVEGKTLPITHDRVR